MKTYDPADSIVYRHMNPQTGPYAALPPGTQATDRLPVGYTNGSPGTRLSSRLARAA